MHEFVRNLLVIYLITTISKFCYYSIRISYGKKLIKKIDFYHNNSEQLSRLFPQLKEYCDKAKIQIFSHPYNERANLTNTSVQKCLISSLNKAIGFNMLNRRKCYILFTIYENNKAVSICKTILDVLIKIAGSIITAIIEHMC